uniref:Mitochondrial tricarboxylate transporter n=1 Tax=Aspergillus terreus TaxID=33178 RepID=A0A3G6VFN1_ASPTE|nr:mitochondrial tricarboxylate transporter [Aspergillus terreus]
MDSKIQTNVPLPKAPLTQKARGKRTKGIPALVAGACAGAVEISITYPFESAKTRAQLKRRNHDVAAIRPGIRGWYAGYGATLVGTTLKASVQFASFNIYRSALAGPNGEISTGASMLAGFGAGVTEAVLAVTPAEAIKTKIIDARKVGNAELSTTFGAIAGILRDRGPLGFFSAVGPTILRQSSNAAVKFTVYNELIGLARKYSHNGEDVHPLASTLVGSVTGVCCAWSTQPLDVIKTRMQSLQARQLYGNTFNCVKTLLRSEGIGVFWSGVWFRTGRLSLTSAIMFPVYEKVYKFLTQPN